MVDKIKSQKQIIQLVSQLKKQGKRIVTYNGGFDLLHIGHIQSIQEAKEQGDILIILLNSDKSIQSYKGPKRPIVKELERAEMLTAIEFVDYVTIFDEITPNNLLDKIKPDIHCNGSDWGENCIEREIVEKNGGKIYILKWQNKLSTTNLINKILELYKTSTTKAVFLDRDGTINFNKKGYVHKIEDFEFIPKAIEALQILSNTGYKIIIITNQSGIGRGYYKEEDYKKLNNWMLNQLTKQGVRIDKVYYCPHHPDDKCECRKPKIGLLIQAVKDFGISLNDSWLVGDDERDIIMGRSANVKTIKIGQKMSKQLKLEPNFYAKSLFEAVQIILKNEK